MSASDSSLILS